MIIYSYFITFQFIIHIFIVVEGQILQIKIMFVRRVKPKTMKLVFTAEHAALRKLRVLVWYKTSSHQSITCFRNDIAAWLK
jgi:hypothetical protein